MAGYAAERQQQQQQQRQHQHQQLPVLRAYPPSYFPVIHYW